LDENFNKIKGKLIFKNQVFEGTFLDNSLNYGKL